MTHNWTVWKYWNAVGITFSLCPLCVGRIETLLFQFFHVGIKFEMIFWICFHVFYVFNTKNSNTSQFKLWSLSWWYKMTAMLKIMTSFFLDFHFPKKKEETKLHRIKRDLSNFLIGFTLPFPFDRCMAKGWTLSNILWCSVFKNYMQNWVKWLEHVKRKTLNFNNVFYVRLPSAFFGLQRCRV